MEQAKADGSIGGTGSGSGDGVGIQSITQTTTSTEDDGDNVLTITLTDGTTSEFVVQNGSKGSTPVKGEDYFTDADKEEIASMVDVTDWFKIGVNIPSGADLDSYTTEGKYYVSSTSISNTIVNAPVAGTNYTLFVFKRTSGSSRTQMIIALNNKIYLRSSTSTGTYGAWVTCATTADIDNVLAAIPTKISELENDAGYITESGSGSGTSSLSTCNIEITINSETSGSMTLTSSDGTNFTLPIYEATLYSNSDNHVDIVSYPMFKLSLHRDNAIGLGLISAGQQLGALYYHMNDTWLKTCDILKITIRDIEHYINGTTSSCCIDFNEGLCFTVGTVTYRCSADSYSTSGSDEPE